MMTFFCSCGFYESRMPIENGNEYDAYATCMKIYHSIILSKSCDFFRTIRTYFFVR